MAQTEATVKSMFPWGFSLVHFSSSFGMCKTMVFETLV